MLKLIIIALVGSAESKFLRYKEIDPHRLLSSSANYCGSTFDTAAQCTQACPNGVDSECSSGETCFAGVTCSSSGGGGGGDGETTTGNYCGSTFDTATQCTQACPNGVDSECSSGERCYAGVTCSSSGGGGGGDGGSGGGGGGDGGGVNSPAMTLTTSFVQAGLDKYNELQGANEVITQALVDQINGVTGGYTLYRQLAFVAQTIWESAGYRYREEQDAINGGPNQGNYQTCDWNNESVVATNGQFFYGRGYMQLSWCANYRRYGEDRYGDAEKFYNDPGLVAMAPYDMDSAAWFFETDVTDSGGQFGLTTKAINGDLECCVGCSSATPQKRYEIFVALANKVGLTGYSEGGCYN